MFYQAQLLRWPPGAAEHLMCLSKWAWTIHQSRQLNSEPALADGAGKALLGYHVCAHTGALSAQLHCNNLQVAINEIPAGLLSHMDMTPKQGFLSFSVLPASCSHQSVSSESEKISKKFSSPTSHRIEYVWKSIWTSGATEGKLYLWN